MIMARILHSIFVLGVTIAMTASAVAADGMTKSEVKMNLEEFQEIFASARLNQAELRVLEQKKRHEAEHLRKIKELDEAIRQSKVMAEKERVADHQALFPENYKVLTQRADGLFNSSDSTSGVEGDVASFAIEIMVRVMQSKWTTIPLANVTSMVASDWEVSWMSEDGVADKDTSADSWYTTLDPVTDSEAMLLIRNEQQVLATNKTGLFRIRFNAHSRVRKDRKLNSVGLSSLLYPLSGASLTICSSDQKTTSNEDLAVGELGVNPAAAVLKVEPYGSGCARISIILPLQSVKFDVHWLDVVAAAKKQKQSEPGIVDEDSQTDDESLITVSHDVMHTIEEGVIRSTNILQFETSESGISSVEFNIFGPKGTRVTSVSGYGLSRWTAGQYNTTDSMIPVRAYFKTSNLDSSTTIHVHTESDTDAAKAKQELELPRIECPGALRQTGRIGVIKVANNVELHQSSAVGLGKLQVQERHQHGQILDYCLTHTHLALLLARAEPSEVASQLRLNTNHPVMLAYKYLNPNYNLRLRATSHEAMDTLEAVVDRAHYEVGFASGLTCVSHPH